MKALWAQPLPLPRSARILAQILQVWTLALFIACGGKSESNKVPVTSGGPASNAAAGQSPAAPTKPAEATDAITNPQSLGLAVGPDTKASDLHDELLTYDTTTQKVNDDLAAKVESIDFNFDDGTSGNANTSKSPVIVTSVRLTGMNPFTLQGDVTQTQKDISGALMIPLLGAVSTPPITSNPTNTDPQVVAAATYTCLDASFDEKWICETAKFHMIEGDSQAPQKANTLALLRRTDLQLAVSRELAPEQPGAEYQTLIKLLMDPKALKFATMDTAEVIHGNTFVRISIGLDLGNGKIATLGVAGQISQGAVAAGVAPQIGGELKPDLRTLSLALEKDSLGKSFDDKSFDTSLNKTITTSSITKVTSHTKMRLVLYVGASRDPLSLDLNRVFKHQTPVPNPVAANSAKPHTGTHHRNLQPGATVTAAVAE